MKIEIAFITLLMILLAYLPQTTNACLAANGIWINCSISTTSSPINNINNTIKNNAPWYFFWLYGAIYVSIAIFLLRQDRSFARFNAITFAGMLVGIVFEQYGLVTPTVGGIAIALFGLTLLASFFFR